MANIEWTHEPETFSSSIGEVQKGDVSGIWRAWVFVGGKRYMIAGDYESAPVAIGVVERTYAREVGKIAEAGIGKPVVGMPTYKPVKETLL
jgi:hypothetical protein